MNGAEAKSYFLSCLDAIEDFPFGNDTPVFKIKGKMFGFLRYKENVAQINLKCNPEEGMVMRDIFEAVIPGYHMNKEHWNTVILDGTVPKDEIENMIDISYSLVIRNLRKSDRLALETKYKKKLAR